MLTFLARRVALGFSVIMATLVVTFALFFLAPTDPAAAICGSSKCTEARIQDIEQSLGLDKPVSQQFSEYFTGLFAGRDFIDSGLEKHCPAPCLGYSYKTGQPVFETILDALPVTLSLIAGASVIFFTVGVAIGSLAARRRGSASDRALVGTTLVLSSIPYYVVALLIFLYLVISVPVLPRPEYVPFTTSPSGWALGLLTPWLVLGLYNSTAYARYSRGSMIETLSEDYVRTARAKGLSEFKVTFVHGLRSSITPVVTILGLDIAALLVGSIFTERIFDLHGIGNLVLEAFNVYDLPVIMGTVIVGAVILVAMNIIVDVVYSFLDPRVRLT